jgi:hypothetical protein
MGQQVDCCLSSQRATPQELLLHVCTSLYIWHCVPTAVTVRTESENLQFVTSRT